MKKLFAIITAAFVLVSCMSEDPEPKTDQSTDEANGMPPSEPPSTPDADGGAANHSLCAAFSASCAYTYIWPLSPLEGTQVCYCMCNTFDDCKNMPGGQTVCGTMLKTDADGGVVPVFPMGWPTVCRVP